MPRSKPVPQALYSHASSSYINRLQQTTTTRDELQKSVRGHSFRPFEPTILLHFSCFSPQADVTIPNFRWGRTQRDDITRLLRFLAAAKIGPQFISHASPKRTARFSCRPAMPTAGKRSSGIEPGIYKEAADPTLCRIEVFAVFASAMTAMRQFHGANETWCPEFVPRQTSCCHRPAICDLLFASRFWGGRRRTGTDDSCQGQSLVDPTRFDKKKARARSSSRLLYVGVGCEKARRFLTFHAEVPGRLQLPQSRNFDSGPFHSYVAFSFNSRIAIDYYYRLFSPWLESLPNQRTKDLACLTPSVAFPPVVDADVADFLLRGRWVLLRSPNCQT